MSVSTDELQRSVLEALSEDQLSVELKLALFSAALLSYRADSCLRPYPDFLQDGAGQGGEEKDMERLVS